MSHPVELQGIEVSRGFRAKVFWYPVLLAAFAASAHAGPIGICLISTAFGSGGNSTAQYASDVITAGCIPGFSDTLVAGGVVNPLTLGPGLTTGTLEVSQPMPFGGTAVATSTASLEQGVLRDDSNTAGGVGGCGGTCTTTGGRAISESLFADNLTFTILDGAPSALVTLNAHLDGSIVSQGTSGDNYNILDEFGLGGDGCWGSATGLGFQPCLSQNFGFLTSSFTDQSATGFDFTGTFEVTNGATDPLFAALEVDCQGGTTCDFSNTASFSLSLPSDVTFTSDSGVLFSESATPEPATFVMAGAALLCLGSLRRRSRANRRID